MCFPFSRRGAAIAGLALACLSARTALAGPVAPPRVESVAIDQPALVEAATLTSPVAEVQPFWYPGAKDGIGPDTVTLSSVPVQTTALGGAGNLAGSQQHPLIPLPGAAWTGLAGLMGLAAVKVGRNFRRFLT